MLVLSSSLFSIMGVASSKVTTSKLMSLKVISRQSVIQKFLTQSYDTKFFLSMLFLVIKINIFINFNLLNEFFNFFNRSIFVFDKIKVEIFYFLDFFILWYNFLLDVIIKEQTKRDCFLMDLLSLFFIENILRIFTSQWNSSSFVLSYDFFRILAFLKHFKHQQNIFINVVATKASTLYSKLLWFLIAVDCLHDIFRFNPILSYVSYDLHKRFNRFWLFILLSDFFFKVHCFLNAVFDFINIFWILNKNLLSFNR